MSAPQRRVAPATAFVAGALVLGAPSLLRAQSDNGWRENQEKVFYEWQSLDCGTKCVKDWSFKYEAITHEEIEECRVAQITEKIERNTEFVQCLYCNLLFKRRMLYKSWADSQDIAKAGYEIFIPSLDLKMLLGKAGDVLDLGLGFGALYDLNEAREDIKRYEKEEKEALSRWEDVSENLKSDEKRWKDRQWASFLDNCPPRTPVTTEGSQPPKDPVPPPPTDPTTAPKTGKGGGPGKGVLIGGGAVLVGGLVALGGGGGSKSDSGSAPAAGPAPTASFTTSPGGVGIAGFTVYTFTASGTATSYEWSFPDGGTGTGQTVTRVFRTAGTFTVTLTGRGNGQSTTATGSVTVARDMTGSWAGPFNNRNSVVSFSPPAGTTATELPLAGTYADQFDSGPIGGSLVGTGVCPCDVRFSIALPSVTFAFVGQRVDENRMVGSFQGTGFNTPTTLTRQ